MADADERYDYGRALLTDRGREILAGEADDVDDARRRDEAQRARYRIRERLPDDLEALAAYEGRDGTLLDELRAEVCPTTVYVVVSYSYDPDRGETATVRRAVADEAAAEAWATDELMSDERYDIVPREVVCGEGGDGE